MSQQTYSPKKTKELMERGIYRGPTEDTFVSTKEIRREKALKGELPIFETPLAGEEKGYDYWSERFQQRHEQYKESTSFLDRQHAVISFKGDTIINFIGDLHVGSAETNYERIHQELDAILGTPNSYIIFIGDLVDGFFWGKEAQMEEMEQTPEQWKYVDALLKKVAKAGRLLIGFGGDHDGWPKKMGVDPYHKFSQELGAYYMQGVGHLTAKVGDIPYRLTGAHQLPGHSIRDNTWAPKRASAEIQGADIYFSAHTHKKGHSLQAIKAFGGVAKKVNFISIGPYKSGDDFSRKHGWAQQTPEEMYGAAVILRADREKVDYFDDILEANS